MRRPTSDTYSGLATQFEHFKDAWRNHAIHVHGIFYDEPKAQIVYVSVREFMRELAKHFSSVPKDKQPL
jgi:hypothetical protein